MQRGIIEVRKGCTVMTGEEKRAQVCAEVSRDGAAEDDTLVVSREVVDRFSHRLLSMLTAMGAAAEYVLDNDVDRSVQEEMLGIVSEQAERIEGLLDDFLVVASAPAARRSSGAVVDLYHVTREVVRDLAAEAQSVGAWLVLDAAGGASTVFGDRSLLRQAVITSIRAMINLTRPGDRVVARLRQPGDGSPSPSTIELSVTLETDQSRFREGAAAFGSADLSLDAARRICEHHGGTFSTMEGRPGVICRLPAAPMREGPLSAAGGAARIPGRGLCVGQ